MQIRNVFLEVDGLNIAGQLYLPGEQFPYPAVSICHGVPAGAPALNDGGYPALAERICHGGLAAFIFNFRGAGFSEGNLDMKGWTRDLITVVDYLLALPETGRLALLGFSAGAAVSVYVAAKENRVSSVVACACPAEFTLFVKNNAQSVIDHFRSIGVIRDEKFPPSIDEWLGGFKLVSPIEYIAGIAPRPLLLVHGNKDEVVDVSHARMLYERAGEPKRLVIIDGAGHRLRQNDEAMAIVISWLKSQN